ncbi:hypothetical protein D3C76_1334330 [compost metagenome]
MVRRVVQIDGVRTRHVEFKTPQRVGRSRSLADPVREVAGRHHIPVDHCRVDHLSIVAPAGKHGITVFLEVAAVTHRLRHNVFAHQRGRHVPRRVNYHIVQRTVHQRRLAAGPPYDHP